MSLRRKTTLGEQGYEIGVGVSDTVDQADAGYWGLTANASDADIWAALTRTMVSVNVGESESAYIYNSTDNGKKIGSVSGLSQGLNLIEDLDDGWSARGSLPQRGRRVRPRLYPHQQAAHRRAEQHCTALSIDKAAQTLTVYKNGERIGSCAVSTGLPTVKYLHRETPAGEFITVTRRGTIENSGGYSKYTVRISGNYHLCEIPTTKKNGKDYLPHGGQARGRRPRAATSASRTTNLPTAASTPSGFGTLTDSKQEDQGARLRR